MKAVLAGFLSGALFAAGLVISGMTQPGKVTGFLDVTGAWDPSLALVMVGAIGVHFIGRWLLARRSAPALAAAFENPIPTRVDAPLVVGSAVFGIGWGIAGFCPGPAIVAAGAGVDGLLFVFGMGGGIALHHFARSLFASRGAADVSVRPLAVDASPTTDG